MDSKLLRVLSVLDTKKMIPVPEGFYHKIDFNQIEDFKYLDLLWKEVRVCRRLKDQIIEKARETYGEQKKSGKVYPMYCNFTALEEACNKYAPTK